MNRKRLPMGIKQRMKQNKLAQSQEKMEKFIYSYIQEIHEEMNFRLLCNQENILEQAGALPENVLWVESITVNDIVWPAEEGKWEKLRSVIKGIITYVKKLLHIKGRRKGQAR